MSKEIKNENETKTTETESEMKVAETETEEVTNSDTSLKVVRVSFVSNGKTYWGYFIKGKIANHDVKVELIPDDAGGYGVLELVYLFSDEAFLNVKTTVSKNSMGRKVSYTNYEVYNIDPNTGKKLKMTVRPARKSDASLLDMIIDYMKK